MSCVATVLTVYGIETILHYLDQNHNYLGVATAPTVYGIETDKHPIILLPVLIVATVLTVYGIETKFIHNLYYPSNLLQQYLPFMVLKLTNTCCYLEFIVFDCNSAYRLRY